MKKYTQETKQKCIQLKIAGRTTKSINAEYGLGVGTLNKWLEEYNKNNIPEGEQTIQEIIKENNELRKENEFLKKVSAYFAKEQKK